MTQFVKVGSRAEFEDLEGGKVIEADGQCIAVFNIGGSYYAIENTCPHRGGPLAEGMVTGEEVICPWHGSRFNVKTGSVVTPPARQGVKSFPVRVTGNDSKSLVPPLGLCGALRRAARVHGGATELT
jgi:nitrite reductase/ring-hydroxylating ferredoxin subunit